MVACEVAVALLVRPEVPAGVLSGPPDAHICWCVPCSSVFKCRGRVLVADMADGMVVEVKRCTR